MINSDYTSLYNYITNEVLHARFSLEKFKELCGHYDRLTTTSKNKKYVLDSLMDSGTFELMDNNKNLAEEVISHFCDMILAKYNGNKEHSQAINNFDRYTSELSKDELMNMIIRGQHHILPEVVMIMKELQKNPIQNPKEDL